MALSPRQQTLIDDLNLIEDVQERLAAVMDRTRKRAHFHDTDRREENRVVGCQSQVWLRAEAKDNTLQLFGDSDSPLVRGLVILTCDFFSGETAETVAAGTDLDPVNLVGLNRNLSATRQNGIAAVRAQIRVLAQSIATKKS